MRLIVCALSFLVLSLPTFAQQSSGAPVLRLRLGMNLLNFTVGDIFVKKPLGAMMTFNPTVLWNLPTFRSRIGVQFVGDFASKYGFMPISGVGIASYFYPFGLSTAYEISPDSTLMQKSRPSPYIYGLLTPVNFNLNVAKEDSGTGSALSFSAYMIEATLGAGYDYPIGTNTVIAGDFQYRFASAQERSTSTTVSYSGLGIMLTFSTSYH